MARFDRLTATLSALGEKDLHIKEAVVVKFGHLLLAGLTVPSNSDFPITEEEAIGEKPFEYPRNVVSTIHAALKDHPNVFDPRIIVEISEVRWGDKFGFFVHGNICQYRIHLPKAKQKYTDDMDTEEHFSVLCDGSMFAAYAPIQDFPIWSNIGHEFRELGRSQIESKTSLKSPNIGPCPIHPNIVIVVREHSEEDKDQVRKYYHQDDDIFFVTSVSNLTTELVAECFLIFRSSIGDFYELAVNRVHMLNQNVEVSNHFSAASSKIRELMEMPSWNIWRTRAASRQARISIASVHERLVELEGELLDYASARAGALENLRKSGEASPLYDYCKGMTEADVNVPPSFGSALTFFEGELQLYGNIRSLLYASLLGAIVGSLLTGVLSRFMH